jgi:hypothetical protein
MGFVAAENPRSACPVATSAISIPRVLPKILADTGCDRICRRVNRWTSQADDGMDEIASTPPKGREGSRCMPLLYGDALPVAQEPTEQGPGHGAVSFEAGS